MRLVTQPSYFTGLMAKAGLRPALLLLFAIATAVLQTTPRKLFLGSLAFHERLPKPLKPEGNLSNI